MPEQSPDRFAGPVDVPDRYQLLDRRSAGGEGEIWNAVEQHASFSFRYAIKIIHAEHLADADRWLENLRLQVALLTQVEHPALVKVREVFIGPPPHAAGQADPVGGSRLYLVMKWIEGRSLQEALESGQVSGLAVLDPLEKVAEAVDYLHGGRDTQGKPVLHRDIKPANILLSDDGRVYLVDFGLVRFEGAATMSKVSGTVPFMAPESLHRGEYSPATDRYAVGATLFYALTGETPVPGDIDGMTRRLTAVLGDAQSRMVHGILSMLSVSPSHRPQTATGWLRALRTRAAETTLGAPPLTDSPAPVRPAQAETSFAAPVLSTPAVPPMPPPVTYGPPPPPPIPYGPPPFPGKPQQKKSGGKIAAIIGGALALVLVACCGLSLSNSIFGNGTGLGSSPSPSISVDHKVPPPSVQALQPIQVSVAQIIKVTGGETSDISQASDGNRGRLLMGGLNNFQPCAEGTVSGAAIGSQTSNGFYIGSTYIASSVAGFYGTAAVDFFKSASQMAERCGWSKFEMSKLGQESVAYSRRAAEYSNDPNILVLVRSGQVIFELTLNTKRGSAQADATQLAAGMAKKMPAAK